MVYPGIPVESPSRSTLEPPGITPAIYQTPSSTPSVILPQQQLVYTSYNAYCGVPQVQSTFPDIRRHAVTNTSHYNLRTQDYRSIRSPKWNQKSRPRYKEYPQVALQQPIPFPAPVVLYDPLQNHLTAPLNPVYLPTPTCYSQPCPTETFSTYNQTVIPHTYYKPPDPQQFCVIHDRPSGQSQLPHQGVQQTQQTPYYLTPSTYTTTRPYRNSSTGFSSSPGAASSHGQSNSNFMDYSNDKIAPAPGAMKIQHSELLYPERNSLTSENRSNLNESVFEMMENPKAENPPHTPTKSSSKLDKYFDDSSNFDFTIEAEKMVSALCNTSLELDKSEEPAKIPLLKPEGISKHYKSWYLDDYPKSSRTVETQTSHPEDLQSPEVIRRMIYTGCTEMENLLTPSNSSYRRNWLLSLSSATKIALSKSSTCFPIYLNDRAFGQDLMNSFLRISNGWLALDNYLNKQPNLSLSQKFDKDLQKSFKAWESATSTLLDNITKNFKKLDTSSEEPFQENPSHTSSFPGDVSLYVNYNLFSNSPGLMTTSQVLKTNRNVSYPMLQTNEQKPRWLSVARESKVRTKWTITENSRNVNDLQTFPTHIQNLMMPQPSESTNIETTMSIWSPCISSAPLYSNLLYPNQNSSNVTLVGQMESKKIDNSSAEGETINLSAWFASMRSRDDSPSPGGPQNFWGTSKTSMSLRETPKSTFDVVGTSKMDANRQLRTLKNMRMIQSAPWTANQILEEQNSTKKKPDDSIKDTQVYMKPGSYNVPKKRGQSKRSRKNDSSGFKKNCPPAESVLKPPTTFLEAYRKPDAGENPEITSEKGNFSNVTSSSSSTCSQDVRRDVTWKAACASAELLLDALNVKKKPKIFERKDEDFHFGYEASEEEEDETLKSIVVDSNGSGKEGEKRTNVKTDSWLIKTLNNAAKNGENSTKCSGDEQRNSNRMREPWAKPQDNDRSFSLETSHTVAVMTLVDAVGKATYSETVRRFSTTTKPTSSKFSSQKCLGSSESPKDMPICSVTEDDERVEEIGAKVASEKSGKPRKGKGQSNDKGWSVWYSSRRKQQSNSLEPATLEKLSSIYRILWKMDVTRLFKFPAGSSKETESSFNFTIEDYRKVIKSPMFLETIGYKLKNQVYRKVEHVIRDFRKIVHNSKTYHKNDKDCTEKIDVLSRKLEELVDQNFADDIQPKSMLSQSISAIPAASGSPKQIDEKEITASTRRSAPNPTLTRYL
ncbi:uncharacterized protein [Fopius arisanus]|uniref:Bromo domain-containing protein n=3 Tax=Fopius arisanus TaxID=64838 RepID=A0A9R1UBP6_9HYME|nr:PREDICTED: uncharacterized protein LOC105273771 [Fopius arisanus]